MNSASAVVVSFPVPQPAPAMKVPTTPQAEVDLDVLFKTWRLLQERPDMAPMLDQLLDDIMRE
jgi:hypothetical protein